jgi:putative ABC transport system ATP-binding protein
VPQEPVIVEQPSREPIVHLDRVSKDYREGAETRRVLHEATASFVEGEIVAIRGRSGSGKSTLLNLVAGIDSPTAGDVWVAGTCLNRLSPAERTLFRRDHLGFVFQFFNLIPTLRVLENVQLPAELRGLSAGEAAERARALLGEVGLAGREDAFPDRLSGGEQQRVAMARALVQDPRILLADEPTGNLDDTTGEAVMDLLERLTRAAGRTLILVTHSPKVASRADRAHAIEAGRVVPLGPDGVGRP